MVWIALSISLGCNGGGQSGSGDASLGPKPNDGLLDLRDLLKELGDAHRPMPKGVGELTEHEAVHPAATAFIQNGSVVYVWGSGIQSGSGAEQTVIAHESQAGAQGGWVLLQDGSVKQMTAEEFQAAKKP